MAASAPIRTADELAAAFLAGYGATTREAYARDLRAWGAWLSAMDIAPLRFSRFDENDPVKTGYAYGVMG